MKVPFADMAPIHNGIQAQLEEAFRKVLSDGLYREAIAQLLKRSTHSTAIRGFA